jgi:hypothetical protein
MRTLAAWLLLGLAIVGCARHVVVEPEAVPSLGDPDWKVTSEPGRGARDERSGSETPD